MQAPEEDHHQPLAATAPQQTTGRVNPIRVLPNGNSQQDLVFCTLRSCDFHLPQKLPCHPKQAAIIAWA